MDYSKKYTIKKHGGLGSGGNGVVKTAIAVATGEEVALMPGSVSGNLLFKGSGFTIHD